MLGHRDVAAGSYEVVDESPPEVVGAELLRSRGLPEALEDVLDRVVTYAPSGRPAVLQDRPTALDAFRVGGAHPGEHPEALAGPPAPPRQG